MVWRRLGHRFPHSLDGPLGWFWRGWRNLIYVPRPDVVTSRATHEHWAQLNSHWRTVHCLMCMWGPPGHIYKNILYPWLVVMSTACLVTVLAMLDVVWGIETVPLGVDVLQKAYQLTSFIVSLLLSQRLGRAYDHWTKTMTAFGALARALVDMAQDAHIAKSDAAVQAELERWGVVLLHSTLRLLRHDHAPGLQPAEAAVLTPDEAAVVLAAKGGAPRLVLGRLKQVAAAAQVPLDTQLNRARDAVNDGFALVFQAPPQAISQSSSGFLLLWLLIMPFGLVDLNSNFWLVLPSMMIIAALMLGCDEIATQLDYPWPLLPLEDVAEAAKAELRDWRRHVAALAALEAAKDAPGMQQGQDDDDLKEEQAGLM